MDKMNDHQRAMQRARSHQRDLSIRPLLALLAGTAGQIERAAHRMRTTLEPTVGAHDPSLRRRGGATR